MEVCPQVQILTVSFHLGEAYMHVRAYFCVFRYICVQVCMCIHMQWKSVDNFWGTFYKHFPRLCFSGMVSLNWPRVWLPACEYSFNARIKSMYYHAWLTLWMYTIGLLIMCQVFKVVVMLLFLLVRMLIRLSQISFFYLVQSIGDVFNRFCF